MSFVLTLAVSLFLYVCVSFYSISVFVISLFMYGFIISLFHSLSMYLLRYSVISLFIVSLVLSFFL